MTSPSGVTKTLTSRPSLNALRAISCHNLSAGRESGCSLPPPSLAWHSQPLFHRSHRLHCRPLMRALRWQHSVSARKIIVLCIVGSRFEVAHESTLAATALPPAEL